MEVSSVLERVNLYCVTEEISEPPRVLDLSVSTESLTWASVSADPPVHETKRAVSANRHNRSVKVFFIFFLLTSSKTQKFQKMM